MSNKLENTMGEIKESLSRYSGLILHQLDAVYPKDQKREIVRGAILSALGNRGLLTEIQNILVSQDINESPTGGCHE